MNNTPDRIKSDKIEIIKNTPGIVFDLVTYQSENIIYFIQLGKQLFQINR